MLKLTFAICTVLFALKCVTAYQQSLSFDNCYTTYYVNNGHSYKLTWNGYKYFSGCQVTFHGYNPDKSLDEYKICIRATNWNVQNSGVLLRYYTGLLGTSLQESYNKNSLFTPTIKWCSNGDEYVGIELTTGNTNSYQGSVTLEVTAVKTYTYDDYYNYGTTVGAVIGSLVLVSIVVAVIGVVVRRRRYVTTTYSSPAPSATVVTQSGSQQMGGYTTGPVPPPQYAAAPPPYPPTNTNYPTGYNTPYSQYPAGGPKY